MARDRRLVYASHGYSTHDLRFLRNAVDAGWEVLFARFDGGARSLCDEELPNQVTELPWIGSREVLTDANRSEFVLAFGREVNAWRAHIVHAGPITTVADVAIGSVDIPVLAMSWASDLLVDAETSADAAAAARRVMARASAVLVDCRAVADKAIGYGADPDKLITVPWGVDLDAFPYVPPRTAPNTLRLLCLRSFEPIYDVATLIRAVAVVNDESKSLAAELTLAGSGSLESELRQLAANLGISDAITWTGRVPESVISSLLADCDIHVSPALSDGTSISLLQAMATGRPSIVTDIPSNQEWIHNGQDGWLYPAGSINELSAAIQQAWSGRERFFEMGSSSRATAEKLGDWRANRIGIITRYVLLLNLVDPASL